MTTFQLKLLAAALMLLDHIGVFIPGAPVWLRWLGRLSAPLFVFCAVQGFLHTRSRWRYLRRLYLAGLGMALLQVSLPLENNIFRTLFFICLVEARCPAWAVLFVLWQAVGFAFCLVLDMRHIVWPLSGLRLSSLATALCGSFYDMEYGLPFVLCGLLFYRARANRRCLAAAYAGYSALEFLLRSTPLLNRLEHFLLNCCDNFETACRITDSVAIMLETSFDVSFFWPGSRLSPAGGGNQWMMVAALPLLLLYNGRRGRSWKWFFYLFYPLHILLLYYIGLILDA